MGNNGQQWTIIRGATCISDAIFHSYIVVCEYKRKRISTQFHPAPKPGSYACLETLPTHRFNGVDTSVTKNLNFD